MVRLNMFRTYMPNRLKKLSWACQLLAVLLLIYIFWHAVSCVEIVARRRVRLPSSVLFFAGKFWSSLVDLA